tara:strand:+ start:1442 stop:2167 length:726 start_codon:yes stop_codon:yes gene_type:complete
MSPIFVLKYGPPASGKGSKQVRDVIESFGFDIDTYVHFNVDDIVEGERRFVNNTMVVVPTLFGPKNDANKILDEVTEKNVKPFSNVYLGIKKNLNVKAKITRLKDLAIEKRLNITYEMTGSSGWPTWTSDISRKGYKVKVLFPVIHFEDLWSRYKKRAIKMYKEGKGFRFGVVKKLGKHDRVYKETMRETYVHSYNNMIAKLKKSVKPEVHLLIDGISVKVTKRNKKRIIEILESYIAITT